MVNKAVDTFRKWIAVSGVALALFAIALSLGLNAQRSDQIDGNVQRSSLNRCLDAREGKARQLKVVQILADLDAADGRVSPGVVEFQKRVISEYRVLRACKQLGLSSEIQPTKEQP